MKQLLLENKAALERVDKVVEKIHKKMIWGAIGSVLKIVLILAPIIFGVIYLSPFVKQYMGGIQAAFDILNPGDGQNSSEQIDIEAGSIDIEAVCDPKVQEMIEKMCK